MGSLSPLPDPGLSDALTLSACSRAGKAVGLVLVFVAAPNPNCHYSVIPTYGDAEQLRRPAL